MMDILGKKITKAVLRNHFFRYGFSLFANTNKFISLLSQFVSVIRSHNLYICPLCTKKYFVELPNGVQGNGQFSLDHVPPESVGGKFTVITCKVCNNKAGENEAELLKILEFGSVPDKKYNSVFPKARIKKKNSEETFKTAVQVEDNTVDFKFNEAAKKHDLILKKFVKELRSGQADELTILIPQANLSKAHKALLKSAYLICFIWWGYEFVYSHYGELIRKVLNDEIDYPVTVPTIFMETDKHPVSKGVGIVTNEETKGAFLINIEIKNGNEYCLATVLIPTPTETGWEDLRIIEKSMKDNLELTYSTIPMIIPKRIDGYTFSWNNFR